MRPPTGQQQRAVGAQLLGGGQGAVVDGVAVLIAQDGLQRCQRGQRVFAKAIARPIGGGKGQRRLFQVGEVVLVHLLIGPQGSAQELLLAQVVAAGNLDHRMQQCPGPLRFAGDQPQRVGRFQPELLEREALHRRGGER